MTYAVLEEQTRRTVLHLSTVARGLSAQQAVDMRATLGALAPRGIDYHIVAELEPSPARTAYMSGYGVIPMPREEHRP